MLQFILSLCFVHPHKVSGSSRQTHGLHLSWEKNGGMGLELQTSLRDNFWNQNWIWSLFSINTSEVCLHYLAWIHHNLAGKKGIKADCTSPVSQTYQKCSQMAVWLFFLTEKIFHRMEALNSSWGWGRAGGSHSALVGCYRAAVTHSSSSTAFVLCSHLENFYCHCKIPFFFPVKAIAVKICQWCCR